jgi:hypothetical protein
MSDKGYKDDMGHKNMEKVSSVDHVATELRMRNRGGIGLSDELIVNVIRLYGFVHLDDVVSYNEGATHKTTLHIEVEKNTPITVRDLIGRE